MQNEPEITKQKYQRISKISKSYQLGKDKGNIEIYSMVRNCIYEFTRKIEGRRNVKANFFKYFLHNFWGEFRNI